MQERTKRIRLAQKRHRHELRKRRKKRQEPAPGADHSLNIFKMFGKTKKRR